MNNAGTFTWTPGTSDAGTHTITVYATDSFGHTAHSSVTITIGSQISLSAPSPSNSITYGSPVTFATTLNGFTNPAYSVQDSFSGSSLTNAAINSSGSLYWVPTANDVGTHTITIYATDSYGHTANAQMTIYVSSPNTTVAASPSSTLNALKAQLTQVLAQLAAAKDAQSAFMFTKYLYPGLTDYDVTQLQNVLAAHGYYSGPITGFYGAQTEAAVRDFQRDNGLAQLGVVGPGTRSVLNLLGPVSASASNSATIADTTTPPVFVSLLEVGSTGDEVRALQEKLESLGFFSGAATGRYGAQTRNAVVQYQKAHGITPAGYVGPATRNALNSN